MKQIAVPRFNRKKISSDIKDSLQNLSKGGFKKIFDHIDQLGIKRGVDEMGIDKFINQCALLAAGSGIVTGAGGFSTILIGMPLDLINLITQQFRVTMAIAYYRTGSYQLNFDDFIRIVATSLKGDARMTVTKNIMEEVAEKLMVNLGSKTVERLVPVVGAVIGGSANYLFIKRIAKSLQTAPIQT